VTLRVLAVVTVLVAGPIVAGCSGSESEDGGATTANDPYLEVQRVPAAGVSVAIPRTWEPVPLSQVANADWDEEGFSESESTEPKYPTKFVAKDLSPIDGVHTSVWITVIDIPDEMSLEEHVRDSVKMTRDLPGIKGGVESTMVPHPQGPASKISYRVSLPTAQGMVTTVQESYRILIEGTVYAVEYNTSPDGAKWYGDVFERSFHTFRVL